MIWFRILIEPFFSLRLHLNIFKRRYETTACKEPIRFFEQSDLLLDFVFSTSFSSLVLFWHILWILLRFYIPGNTKMCSIQHPHPQCTNICIQQSKSVNGDDMLSKSRNNGQSNGQTYDIVFYCGGNIFGSTFESIKCLNKGWQVVDRNAFSFLSSKSPHVTDVYAVISIAPALFSSLPLTVRTHVQNHANEAVAQILFAEMLDAYAFLLWMSKKKSLISCKFISFYPNICLCIFLSIYIYLVLFYLRHSLQILLFPCNMLLTTYLSYLDILARSLSFSKSKYCSWHYWSFSRFQHKWLEIKC